MKRQARIAALVATLASACSREPPFAILGPQGATAAAAIPVETPDAPFRAQPPPEGASIPFLPPRVQALTLSNGVHVLFVRRADLPIVSLRFVLTRGAADAPPGQGGFYGEMLLKGTARRSALTIATELAMMGATYEAATGYDATVVSFKTLAPRLDQALDLLRDVTIASNFPDGEVERVRARRLGSLRLSADSPSALLDEQVLASAYPRESPYARTLLGSEADLRAVTRQDLQRLARAWIRPENITLVMVGDTTRAALVPLLERRFGTWRAAPGAPAARAPAPPDAGGSPRVVLVDQPGSTQSHVAIVSAGVARDSPDYDALAVLNITLSGRINSNLRQRHGYTYGASSGFYARRGAGHFQAGGAIDRDHTAEAIKEILAELARVRTEELSPTGLTLSQGRLVLRMPGDFETAAAVAASLGTLAAYGLPLDHYAARAGHITGVTRPEVRRLAERYLAPERLRLVVVGDASAIRKDLEDLHFGPIELRAVARPAKTEPEPPPPDDEE